MIDWGNNQRWTNPTDYGGIVLYGGPPEIPRIRPPTDTVDPLDFFKGLPTFPTQLHLVPCAKCRRHIVYATECPFCFVIELVNSIAKPINPTKHVENERKR